MSKLVAFGAACNTEIVVVVVVVNVVVVVVVVVNVDVVVVNVAVALNGFLMKMRVLLQTIK